jgi:sugar porter (SP) family MFS transporter
MGNETKNLLTQPDEASSPDRSRNTTNDITTSNNPGDSYDDEAQQQEVYQPYSAPHSSLENDDDDESEEMHEGLQRLVLVAAATAATLGYDVGIMAAAIQPMEETMGLNSIQKELAMGSLNFVAALGAILGGKIANDHGRKYTVKVCSWIFVVGTILMACAPGYYMLLLGRIVTGMGVGVSFVVAPVYLSEVAPTKLRGKLNTVFDVAINGGILLGYVLGFLVQLLPNLSEGLKWRVMLGLGIVLPIMVLYNLVHLPESPRWLVMKQQPEAARRVMAGLGSNPRQIYKAISSIEEELQQEEEHSSTNGTSGNSVVHLTPMEAVMQWRYTRGMKLSMALGFWQQITGTEAVLYYSADFLLHAGLESPTQRLLGNCFVGLCKLAPELVAMQWVDKIGRRPLMLASAICLMVSTFLLSVTFYFSWHPLFVVIFLCMIMASFSIGLGPFSFLVASESLGLSERATGMTLCAAVNRCTSGTVALTAVSLYEWLGSSGLFAVYGLIGMASLRFYFTALPETTGQTLEQLAARNREVELQKGVNNRSNNDSGISNPPPAAAAAAATALVVGQFA